MEDRLDHKLLLPLTTGLVELLHFMDFVELYQVTQVVNVNH